MSDTVELTIQGLSGAKVATLQCGTSSTVYEVKQRISRHTETLVGQQQLVYDCSALEDRYTLERYGIAPPQATVQCVRLRPSGVALHLEARRTAADLDEALSACLADVADSVMQAEHQQSERHRPRAAHLARAIPARRRRELVSWMAQAFDALQLTDDVLHSSVLTLDRYYAQRKTPIQDSALQKVILAAVCTEMKLQSSANFPPGQWQRVIGHLSQGRLDLPAILRAETEVLASLGFVVGVPTPLTFLQGLGLRLEELASTSEAHRWRSCALFLLELALLEPSLQHGRAHALLAAGALGAALRACGAPPERHSDLLEDLAAYCPTLADASEVVAACEEELLTHWLRSSRGEGDLGHVYAPLEAKFGRRSHHGVSRLSPEAALRRHHRARLASPGSTPGSTPPSSGRSSSGGGSPRAGQAGQLLVEEL